MYDVSLFWDYLIFYPDEDEEGFDGEHYGGIKGIRDDAPEEAKKEYDKMVALEEEGYKF